MKNWAAPDNLKAAPLPPLETVIDLKVDQKIDEQKLQRKATPHSLPPSAENLSGLVQVLLQQCLGTATPYSLCGVERVPISKKPGPRPAYDLVVRQRQGSDNQEIRIGILILTTCNPTSAAASLRRLVEDPQPPDETVLVTDERTSLPLGAKKDAAGRKHLDKLRQRAKPRFCQLELTFDQYAELDALQAAVGLARSGDLEVEWQGGQSRPVTEPEVVASHHRRDRYRAQVLLKALLGGDRSLTVDAAPDREPAPLRPDHPILDELELRQFLMAQLALSVGLSSQELAVKYVEHCKVLELPPVAASVCKTHLEAVARQLHDSKVVQVTPNGDSLFMLLRKR